MVDFLFDPQDISTSIVIVSWNSELLLDRCLAPFVGHPPSIEVIVFDNLSSDNTVDAVKRKYPWVKLIESDKNLGFGRGNNEAFKYCSGRNILLLNPDAFLDNLYPVELLSKTLDSSSEIAAVGAGLVHSDGRHQVGDAGWTTTLLSLAGHAFWLHRIFSFWPSIYISNPSLLRKDVLDVDWVCGACMMVKRSVIEKIGGFDEQIFMYGEDVEWGDRMKSNGYRVLLLPQLRVLHIQGATQKGSDRIYFSTKWVDARAKRFAQGRSRIAYLFFRIILFAGFGMRGAVLKLGSTFKSNLRENSKLMFRYAKYAILLPSYDDQRK